MVSDTGEALSVEISVVRPAFDVAFYLADNPDLKEKGLDCVEHYVTRGWKEGLNPNRDFDTRFYLERNPDVAAAGINPFVHYLLHGKAEGRSPHREAEDMSIVRSEFDVAFYLAHNPDVKKNGLDPVEHYMSQGWKEGLSPSRHFDTRFYLQDNPDVAAAGINPFCHYLVSGKAEGRSPRRQRWRGLPTKIFRKLNTIYIDAKYGYPLRELLPHNKNHEDVKPALATGDYYQIKMIDSLTHPNDVLVDVGCGQGRIINYWLEKNLGNRIVGIEIDESIALATKERLKKYNNVEIICGDATKCTPLDATFIYMFNPLYFEATQNFADYIWDNRERYIQNHLQIILYNCESAAAFDVARFVQRRIPRTARIPYEMSIIRLRDQ